MGGGEWVGGGGRGVSFLFCFLVFSVKQIFP